MRLSEIKDILGCEVLTGEDDLAEDVQLVVASEDRRASCRERV